MNIFSFPTEIKPKARPPARLSALLRLAVQDAQAAEAAGHRLNMALWAYRSDEERCSVCMAGAIMLNTLGAHPEEGIELVPSDFDDEWAEALRHVNEMRVGGLPVAYPDADHMIPNDARQEFKRIVMEGWNASDSRASWEVYEEAAKLLEAYGH